MAHAWQEHRTEQNEDVLRELEERLHRDDLDGAGRLMGALPPADLAVMLDGMDAGDRVRAFALLSGETAGEVLGEIAPDSLDSLGAASPRQVDEAAAGMAPDDLTDVLDGLPEDRRLALLRMLPGEEAAQIRRLLAYAPDSAGGIMTTEFVELAADITAGQAVQITQRSRENETIAHLFVCDRRDRLVGYLSLDRLVFARAERPVRELMEPLVASVSPETHQEEVVRLATRYDLDVVPVVDGQEKLLGVITVDDILEAAREEADEDAYRIAGTGERDPVHTTVLNSARLRLPWLLMTLAGGFGIAFLVSRFEGALKAVQLAFFIPLIPLMGGNVAIQSSAVVVRGLAVGDIRRGRLLLFTFKQVLVAGLLALSCGLIAGLLAGLMPGAEGGLPFVVGVAVALAITVAGTLGTVLPLAFQKMGADPALSAGPFVTILNDVFCISIYLCLGAALSS